MKFNRPQFITFEGGEGSGKSTQSKLFYEYLKSKNIKAVHTREIGGTIEAEKIRHLIIYSQIEPLSELMMVMAARYEHIKKVIIPALLAGSWVICDRFVDSTACYQSGEGENESGLTIEEIYNLHNQLMQCRVHIPEEYIGVFDFNYKALMPDLTFFMDVPPDIGLKRATSRGDANKFEDKNAEFHHKIYDRFKLISKLYPERIINIDVGNKEVAEIQKMILSYL